MATLETTTDETFPAELVGRTLHSTFFIVLDEDMRANADLDSLLETMLNYSESAFYFFTRVDTPPNQRISEAKQGNRIRVLNSEPGYYLLPEHNRDFVHISQNPRGDWEQELLANGKPFIRFQISLTEIERARLLAKKFEKESSPIKLEPNFMGIGFNLPVVWKLLKACKWARSIRSKLSR